MENIKKYSKIIFKGLVLLLAILFVVNFFRTCNRVSIDKPNNDHTHDSNVVLSHEIKKSGIVTTNRESRLEAGKDTIVKFEIRYKTKIIEIVRLAPDTCNPYLIAMINEAADLDSVQNAQIARLDSNNTEYKNQIGLLKRVIENDSTDKVRAKKEFEKQLKLSNWKWFWKGYRWGFGSGVVVDESARAGIRMIKP